jgi:CIC family chloride channel protein
MTRFASMFAKPLRGEVFVLHVIRVPKTLELGVGRAFLKQGRPILEEAINVGQQYDVPVRTQLRLGRRLSQSIFSAARERNADLVLLNWQGYPRTSGASFGRTLDILSANPPCDLGIIHMVREALPPKRILVPARGGAHARRAIELALDQADFVQEVTGKVAEVVVVSFIPPGENGTTIQTERQRMIEELALEDLPIDLRVEFSENGDIAADILAYAEGFDEIMIGASEEGLLETSLFGSIPQRVALEAQVNVIMVKRYNPIKHGFLTRWFNIGKKYYRPVQVQQAENPMDEELRQGG